MKTLMGHDIPLGTQGVLYLCEYDHETKRLTPGTAILFTSAWHALEAFANIPNPASQLATCSRTTTLEQELESLHTRMTDIAWQEELAGYL